MPLLPFSIPRSTFIVLLTLATRAHAQDFFVYFGTQSVGPDKGFSLAHFDSDTGLLTKPVFLQTVPAPSYFVISNDGKFLYTCNASDPQFASKGRGWGALSAYSIDPKTAHLTLLNKKDSLGSDPSYCSLDAANHFAFVANYNSGTIAAFPINPDGSLGEHTAFIQHTGSSINPQRQAHPYAHSIRIDPSQHFALVCDLGIDKILIDKFDPTSGTLVPNDPPSVSITPGSGPRHSLFHPNNKWFYVISEMGSSITAFNWDFTNGTLTQFQSLSTLPADFKGTSAAAEIAIHPNGKFLYASNRGDDPKRTDDSIALFSINQDNGQLTPLTHTPSGGKTPRNFTFDPTAKWLLVTNHGTNTAAIFKVDPTTGHLTPNGPTQPVPYPFCERFLAVP